MSIKLVYFNLRGRAEFIRFVLEAAGREYEEERITFDNWSKVKPTTPFGTVPYIVYDGAIYSGSGPIATFFAKEFGFYGKTNLDGLRIEEIHSLFEDQQLNGLIPSRYSRDPAIKAESARKVLEEDLPKFLGIYEKFVQDNGGTGFVVGDSLSLGDFIIYDMLDNMIQLKKDVMTSYPLLQKLRHNVESHPKIKAYLARRPETMFKY